MFGSQLAAFAVNSNGRAPSPMPLAYLHTGSTALRQRIGDYVPQGTRVSIIDKQGWLLARAGAVTDVPSEPTYGMRANEDGFREGRSVAQCFRRFRHRFTCPYALRGPNPPGKISALM